MIAARDKVLLLLKTTTELELMFACGGAVSRVPVKFCLDNVRHHSLNCPSLVHKCLSSE